MSGFEDDFSENSFSGLGSPTSPKDDPPTLDDTIFDIGLFRLFLNYMKSEQAMGDLMFLKDARKFRLMNQPRDVIVHQASKLSMKYFSAVAPFPVKVSEETRNKMANIAFDPSSQLELDKESFSPAFAEVYNEVIPHFRTWLATEEWRNAVPFHHLPPPTFNVVLSSTSLRIHFNKFLKTQLVEDKDGSVPRAYQLWKFALIVTDFRAGKIGEAQTEGKKKKKKKNQDESDPSLKEEEKELTPEEYAKRIYKKFKHQISIPYDKSLSYSVFIVRALDSVVAEFDKSDVFARWVALKQYQSVDYQAKVVHQSRTKEGYAEPPSLAAGITSSILPGFMILLQGSEQGMNLEFLTNILLFHRKFKRFDTETSASSSGSFSTGSQDSSGSGKSRKSMIEEAKRIYAKFLEKGEMYCDPGLVEEVRSLITKNGGKGVDPNMFRKIGTFIYHRSEHTWCREARATFDWVIKSYDNYSQSTREVEEEFSLKNLPEGFDLQIVPSIDDVYGNPDLYKDYTQYVNERSDRLYERFLIPLREYSSSSVQTKKASLQKLMSVFSDATTIYPELTATSNLISKEVAKRECVAETVVHSVLASLIRTGAAHFYKKWLVEHSMVWKKSHWSPVAAIKFGDISLIMGMSAVETKIEEEALKGKSGFSRYLAKRQLKKQAIATIRSGASVKLPQEKAIIDTQLGIGKSEMIDPKNIDVSLAAVVPGIDDTLSSPYMRTFFQHAIMEKVLGVEQLELYKALSDFYKKYDVMSNEDLCDSQKQMLGEINEICAKYKRLLPRPDEVKERAKKQKILFPNFFRPVELDLYGRYHTAFEEGLRQKGWK